MQGAVGEVSAGREAAACTAVLDRKVEARFGVVAFVCDGPFLVEQVILGCVDAEAGVRPVAGRLGGLSELDVAEGADVAWFGDEVESAVFDASLILRARCNAFDPHVPERGDGLVEVRFASGSELADWPDGQRGWGPPGLHVARSERRRGCVVRDAGWLVTLRAMRLWARIGSFAGPCVGHAARWARSSLASMTSPTLRTSVRRVGGLSLGTVLAWFIVPLSASMTMRVERVAQGSGRPVAGRAQSVHGAPSPLWGRARTMVTRSLAPS